MSFAAASFVGAYLLFMVQPLMGKQLLPWYGGAPSIWSTCLLFFQSALVAGYGYAHLTRRLELRRQIQLHLALLLLSLVIGPVTLPAALKPHAISRPELSVLVALAVGVGAPYLLLSATAPLLQDWHARARAGPSTYRLYVPSNLGSLGALISYPVLVEPYLTVGAQVWVWRIGLAVAVTLCGLCGWLSLRRLATSEPQSAVDGPAPTSGRSYQAGAVLLCMLLSAAGSALMMATTNQLSQEVAAVPLLWVLPLSLYLLTFVVCFADRYRRRLWSVLLLGTLVTAAWTLVPGSSASLTMQLGAGLGLLMAGCMVCHGELVRLQPHPSRLTEFYLAIALGGALGGAAVALVAPRLFTTYTELPLVALTIPVLLAWCVLKDRQLRSGAALPTALVAVPVGVFVVALGVTLRSAGRGPQTIDGARDFYGVIRVIEDPPTVERVQRGMLHGRILHGAQFVAPELQGRVDNYYGEGSGVELAIRHHPRRKAGLPMTIGVIGLGVGTLAGRGQAGDTVRFFELSPIVIAFANRHFTYLRDSRAKVHIVAGDARLSLEREHAGPARAVYDLIAVDAFSGDSIPIHLLTREALQLYAAVLAPDGALAIHVTNQHLDIGPVVRALTHEAQWGVADIRQSANAAESIRENRWMITSPHARILADLAPYATPEPPDARRIAWTDDFSALLPLVKWR